MQVLRYAIEQRLVDGGLMAGLSDPRLHKALSAVHADPARPWTLEAMAAAAGMSRARFAAHFALRVGVPPGEYLTGWRLGLARSMLRRGLPVKQVAVEVGYANASAFGRVFAQRLGQHADRLATPRRRGARLTHITSKGLSMDIRALAFDTGGTVLDWHGGLVAAFERVGARRRHRRRGLARGRQRLAPPHDEGHRRPACGRRSTWTTCTGACSTRRSRTSGSTRYDAADRDELFRTWHALDAWPDFPAAQAALRSTWPVVSFTMLPVSLVVDVSRRNGIAWDAIISCEMIGVYKPHAESYLTAARWMGLAPAQVLMVACHNFDLNAAHQAGMRTAFVRRPDEWGPEGPPDPTPNMAYDIVVDGFDALHRAVRSLAG